MGKLCSRFLGQKAGCRAPTNPPKGGEDGGALFAVRVQILLSITSFAVQGLSESRIYPRLQSWWSALVQCRTVPRRSESESGGTRRQRRKEFVMVKNLNCDHLSGVRV